MKGTAVFTLMVVICTTGSTRIPFPSVPRNDPNEMLQALKFNLQSRSHSRTAPQYVPPSGPHSPKSSQLLSKLEDLIKKSDLNQRSFTTSSHPNSYVPATHESPKYQPSPPPPTINYVPKKFFYYSVHDPLTNEQIKESLLQLLFEAHLISKDDTLTDQDLETLWYILTIFRDTQFGTDEETKCPYGFTKSDNLCLCGTNKPDTDTGDAADHFDTYRETCISKGGDLAVFKDANEFVSMLEYMKFIDPDHEDEFVIGARREADDDPTLFIDGSLFATHTGFVSPDTGSYVITKSEDAEVRGRDGTEDDDSDPMTRSLTYSAEIASLVPLCQYIKARDGNIGLRRRPSGISQHVDISPHYTIWQSLPKLTKEGEHIRADDEKKTE